MKVFYNISFNGFYPVGAAAVVKADTAEEAAALLEEELSQIGLAQSVNVEDMIELLPEKGVVILNNGDY